MSDIGAITYTNAVAVSQSDTVNDAAGPFAGLQATTAAGLAKVTTLAAAWSRSIFHSELSSRSRSIAFGRPSPPRQGLSDSRRALHEIDMRRGNASAFAESLRLLEATIYRLGQVPRRTAVLAAPPIGPPATEGIYERSDPYTRAWSALLPATLATGRRPPPLSATKACATEPSLRWRLEAAQASGSLRELRTEPSRRPDFALAGRKSNRVESSLSSASRPLGALHWHRSAREAAKDARG